MKISQERTRKSFELYKNDLCSDCLKRFDEILEPFKKLSYDWETVEDLKTRHKAKLLVKIGLWQKSLCESCLQRIMMTAKKEDDTQELQGMAEKYHDKGVGRKSR